jgi:hypothetical protein
MVIGTDLCRYAQNTIIAGPAVTRSSECETLSYLNDVLVAVSE